MLFNKLNNWLRSSFRAVLTVMVAGMLFVSVANPAQAATSNTTDGVASLNKIQAKTDEVASSNPRGIEEVSKEAQEGLNGVQAGMDADKMISAEDADATTVKEKAANFFDKLGN